MLPHALKDLTPDAVASKPFHRVVVIKRLHTMLDLNLASRSQVHERRWICTDPERGKMRLVEWRVKGPSQRTQTRRGRRKIIMKTVITYGVQKRQRVFSVHHFRTSSGPYSDDTEFLKGIGPLQMTAMTMTNNFMIRTTRSSCPPTLAQSTCSWQRKKRATTLPRSPGVRPQQPSRPVHSHRHPPHKGPTAH